MGRSEGTMISAANTGITALRGTHFSCIRPLQKGVSMVRKEVSPYQKTGGVSLAGRGPHENWYILFVRKIMATVAIPAEVA